MRPVPLALFVSAVLALNVRASNLPCFDDAALHAVQFVDGNEGWAVGDEGVVLHTIDGGHTWERQPTGVRGSLRSLHFLNPYTGWVAGREELPHAAGSGGILLFTQDGGLKWQRAARFTLPGLNHVRFLDNQTGYVAGDGTDQFPSGVFATTDTGRTWKPLPGPRCPNWLALDLRDAQTGALAGAWSRLATLRQGTLAAADVDLLAGRNLHALRIVNDRAVAVGQGGLVLLSDTAGARWGYAEGLALAPEVRAGWDFHAVSCLGEHIWVAGRPGSKVLHSADAGRSWETLTTGQPLPLHGLFFADEQRGWAVGELGTILCTADGGRTWHVQRRGGHRAAVLFVHARPNGLPVDTVAILGGQEGYLAVGLRVNAVDPGSAEFGRAQEDQRLAAAVRQAGGAGGEMLWQFPVPQHLARAGQRELLQTWDRLHADHAAEQLLRQLVLALRLWRPSVVITDHPDAAATGCPAEALLAEALHEAFTRAADPKVFPEQIEVLGLEPWQAAKLYGRWESSTGAQVVLDLNEPSAALQATPRDFAAAAAGLLVDRPLPLPTQRFYHLLDSTLQGAADHRDLMEGVALSPQGVARREVKAPAALEADVRKVIRARRNLQTIAETADGRLADPSKLLGQLGPVLAALPDDQGAPAVFAVASQFARLGQWEFAREAFLLMVDRYPAHPLSAAAYRWLIRHNSSSEARRRHELGQFLVVEQTSFEMSPPGGGRVRQPLEPAMGTSIAGIKEVQNVTLAHLRDRAETRRWYQGSLEVGERLAALGPLFAGDPSIGFCLQAARRQLGDFETARQWYAQFCTQHADGPWRDAAASELWLANRTGPPPKPVAFCRHTQTRPFLDGKFDDPCWEGLKPLILGNAVGKTAKDYPTEAWLAHDKDYLYVALRCRHPADHYVPPVKVRPRDADLRAFDRVGILLDLDRDYSTCFHLEVDQRGCVCEDCWGDHGWNPRWFVAVHSDQTSWQIEAAIPMTELTGDGVALGSAWACNIVRVLPGRGVQAWSLPADVQPRPEGMGLLLFTGGPKDQKPEPRPERKKLMNPVP
jgi:photosystem II stability/assembly factor-like uncharacterized protein